MNKCEIVKIHLNNSTSIVEVLLLSLSGNWIKTGDEACYFFSCWKPFLKQEQITNFWGKMSEKWLECLCIVKGSSSSRMVSGLFVNTPYQEALCDSGWAQHLLLEFTSHFDCNALLPTWMSHHVAPALSPGQAAEATASCVLAEPSAEHL